MRSARSLAPRSSAHASAKQPASADSSVHPLIVHDKKEDVDVKFNSKFFPDLKVDDCVEIVPADRATTADAVGNRLVLRVSKEALAPQKGNFHVSLSSQLADLFAFRRAATRQLDVVVRTVTPETAALAFVEISFKDQHISRADMWRLKGALQGHCVYRGKSATVCGLRLQFDECLVGGAPVKNGAITADTKLIFRSRSARWFWLIQVSEECWDFADDGQLYAEKVVHFIRTLFERWSEVGVNHTVSIIFFSRTIFNPSDALIEPIAHTAGESAHSSAATATAPGAPPAACSFNVDAQGNLFRDHYKVVIDAEQRESWVDVVRKLKEEFMTYPSACKWGVRDPQTGLVGQPSRAKDGNALEAINLALNVCDKHYVNRDLQRTGLCISLVTAGVCVWQTSRDLGQLTKQRVLKNGIGCDVIAVCAPPLHASPLFLFPPLAATAHYESGGSGAGSAQQRPSSQYLFHRPHWIQVKYFGDSRTVAAAGTAFQPLPACRMIDLSMQELVRRMGVGEARATSLGSDSDSDRDGGGGHDEDRDSDESDVESVFGRRFSDDEAFSASASIDRLDDSTSQQSDIERVVPSTAIAAAAAAAAAAIGTKRRVKYRPAENFTVGAHSQLYRSCKSAADMHAWDEQVFAAHTSAHGDDFGAPTSGTDGALSLDVSSWWVANGWDLLEARMLAREGGGASADTTSTKEVGRATGGGGHSGATRSTLSTVSTVRPSTSSPHLARIGAPPLPSAQVVADVAGSAIESARRMSKTNSLVKISAPASPQMRPLSSSPGLSASFVLHSRNSSKTDFTAEPLEGPEVLPSSLAASSFGEESPLVSLHSQARRSRMEALANKRDDLRPASMGGLAHTTTSTTTASSGTLAPVAASGVLVGAPKTAQSVVTPSAIASAAGTAEDSAAWRRRQGIEEQISAKLGSRFTTTQYWLRSKDDFLAEPVLIELVRVEDVLWYVDALRKSAATATRTGVAAERSALPHAASSVRSLSSMASEQIVSHSNTTAGGLSRALSAARNVSFAQLSLASVAAAAPASSSSSVSVAQQVNMAAATYAASLFTSINPFVVSSEAPKLTYNRRRWAHLFVRVAEMADTFTLNWKPFCKPAILPLTTDFIPELRSVNLFEVKHYRLALDPRDSSRLFQELLTQRLAQDFQIVLDGSAMTGVASAGAPAAAAAATANSSTVTVSASSSSSASVFTSSARHAGAFAAAASSSVTSYSLSIEGQFQTLRLDATTGDVDVTTHIQKESSQSANVTFPYRYLLWQSTAGAFRVLDATFVSAQSANFKWNNLDEMLTEFADMDFNDSMRFRRIRFAVVPMVEASIGSIALSVSAPTSVAATAVSVACSGSSNSPSQSAALVHAANTSIAALAPPALNLESSPEAPVLTSSSSSSVSVAPTPDASAAAHPATAGFFKFFEGLVQVSNSKLRSPVRIADSVPPLDAVAPDCAAVANAASAPVERMSSVTLTLQSDFPNRVEWLKLAYAPVFHPQCTFHFELHWLAASGTEVDEWVGACRRRAKAAGVRVMQVAIDAQADDDRGGGGGGGGDPFHAPLGITLRSRAASLTLQAELPAFGFVLDGVPRVGDACRLYLHRSCAARLRVHDTGAHFAPSTLPSATLEARDEATRLYARLCQRAAEL